MGNTREGGLYYIGQTAVDAEGKAIKDAPPRSRHTQPHEQPGSIHGPSSEERMGKTIADGIASGLAQAFKDARRADRDDDDERSGAVASTSETTGAGAKAPETREPPKEPVVEELPTIANLAEHISTLTADEVRTLQSRDERKGAQPIYEARLAELEG